jgi:hypothetical protein
MAQDLLPIDQSVKIPEAVKRAAAIADRHYAKVAAPAAEIAAAPVAPPQNPEDPFRPNPPQVILPEPTEPRPLLTQPQPEPVQTAPAADAAAPINVPVPVAAPAEPNWEHRFLSMQGRYNQSQATMGGMQEQIGELSQELARMHQLFEGRARAAPQGAQRLITPEEVTTYGPELIDLTKRAAQEALQPTLDAIQAETKRTRQAETRRQARDVYASLDTSVPEWRGINENAEFLNWLRLPDVYSGVLRGKLLKSAFSSGDAPRVTTFFKNYLAEAQATGQIPAPQNPAAASPAPRVAAVPLVNLAAPGASRPATDLGQQPVDKPIFTHRQVAQFYSHEGRQRYVGREADRVNDEKEIFAAQAEGRIR